MSDEVLAARFAGIDPNQLYGPVIHTFPDPPARVLDIGAGPGRDAGWQAAQGHDVTALDPVAAFRAAGAT